MSETQKLEALIHELYGNSKNKKLSKQELREKVSQAVFPADVEIFFRELPDRQYGEPELINELNRLIKERGREAAMGGLLGRQRQAAKARK